MEFIAFTVFQKYCFFHDIRNIFTKTSIENKMYRGRFSSRTKCAVSVLIKIMIFPVCFSNYLGKMSLQKGLFCFSNFCISV